MVAETKSERQPQTVCGKKRILFVNDDANSLHDLERGLLPFRGDWEFVFAGNALRTNELVGSSFYDAIVVSMRAPGHNTELIEEIMRHSPETMAFIRGNQKETVPAQASLACPPIVLSKEWDAETLTSNVLRALRLKAWTAGKSIRQLMARMERLPSLPALYTQVSSELAKPDASTQFVGRLISKDPAMTAKILQLVNSPAFALAMEITDPAEAVFFLGAERTKSLVLLASLSQPFDKSACKGFSHAHLWQHSMAVGASAQGIAIAQTKDRRLGEMAYTAGLLHDVGKLLLAANLPTDYSEVLALAQGEGIPVSEAEQQAFDVTHAEVGAAVLGTWGLPVSILEAIAWHHSPRKAEDKSFSLLTAVHAANAIEREKVLHSKGKLSDQIDTGYVKGLNLAGFRDLWREICSFPLKLDGL